MDDWLSTYEVEIDEQEVTKLKLLAHQKLQERENKFETSIGKVLWQMILREIRLFSAFAILLTIVLMIGTSYAIEPYGLVACHSAILGAASLLEIFRMYRYSMNEVQFPTKLGMGRMFLYKITSLSIIEFSCILLLLGVVQIVYVVDIYVLIAYAILPNLLVCAGLLGLSMFFHSLLVMMAVYAASISIVTMLVNLLIERLTYDVMHGVVAAFSVTAFCLFLWMSRRLSTYMKEAGGQLLWN